jgi:alkanesulfonate monooxygenase SsuD/methylene tetrahydromethanopterin reductase-like flavin-dependent oxidoreductase (luciferase family)
LGAGYRREEFDALGVDLADRGRLMEEAVDTLKKGWTGEPFEFRGQSVRVMPRPLRQPRPPILMGGSSKAAARRAARIADGFMPTNPALVQLYREEVAALGRDPGPAPAPGPGGGMVTLVAVSENPEAVWAQVAPHCLHEMNTYAGWLSGAPGVSIFWPVADVDALRETGRYAVLTPEQCLEQAKANGGVIDISPLTGGIAPDLAWRSLKLIESKVLPGLK